MQLLDGALIVAKLLPKLQPLSEAVGLSGLFGLSGLSRRSGLSGYF